MMNYQYRPASPNLLDEIRKFFTSGSGLSILILINIVIWILVQVLKVLAFFFNDPEGDLIDSLVLHTLAIPAHIPDLVARPWTLITYNFLHIDLWHILFNMLWLFWFGKIFLEFLKIRQLIWVYILGGITGGLIYVLAFNVFPVFSEVVPVSFALGASASVMAIVTAISFYVPGYAIQLLFIGQVRIGYLAIFLFIFDFIMIPSGNAGGHIAHIGGAIFGVVYTFLFRTANMAYQPKGTGSVWQQVATWFSRRKKRSSKGNQSYQGRPVSDDDYNLNRKNNQRRMDEILEKISKGGYDSLTGEEKEFLFKSSRKQ